MYRAHRFDCIDDTASLGLGFIYQVDQLGILPRGPLHRFLIHLVRVVFVEEFLCSGEGIKQSSKQVQKRLSRVSTSALECLKAFSLPFLL